MTSLSDFPTRTVLVDVDKPPFGPLLNTSRPLLGEPVDIDLRGFTVLAPTDEGHLDQNLRLDAHLLVFVTRAEAAAETRARYAAEYPDADLSDLSEQDLVDGWRMAR